MYIFLSDSNRAINLNFVRTFFLEENRIHFETECGTFFIEFGTDTKAELAFDDIKIEIKNIARQDGNRRGYVEISGAQYVEE